MSKVPLFTASGRSQVFWTAEDVAACLNAPRSLGYRNAQAGELTSLQPFCDSNRRWFARGQRSGIVMVLRTER